MSATVLVVDDNADNVEIMRAILLGEGFEVRIARDGESALQAVREQAPDLILLDVMMPGLDGFEVLDRLKANPRTAPLPVIMVTARSGDDDVLAGYKTGADYYLTKPFTRRQLLYAVGLVLGTEEQAKAPAERACEVQRGGLDRAGVPVHHVRGHRGRR